MKRRACQPLSWKTAMRPCWRRAAIATRRQGARWKARLGKIGYPIGALETALNPPTLRVLVEIDGQIAVDVDKPVLMVAVGNGASVGGGTELTPDAEHILNATTH